MNDNWMEQMLHEDAQDRKKEIMQQLKAMPPMQLKPKIATAVGLIVEAARQSGMLEQISKVWCWRHTNCDVPTADDLAEKLLAQMIEIFDDNIHVPGATVEMLVGSYDGDFTPEQIAPFSGLRVR